MIGEEWKGEQPFPSVLSFFVIKNPSITGGVGGGFLLQCFNGELHTLERFFLTQECG